MITVHFQLADGRRVSIEGEAGNSVMQEATYAGVPGVGGACGGYCSCATCRVRVLSAHRLPSPSDEEMHKLLEEGSARGKRAIEYRLACQLVLTTELDGLLLQPAA